MKFRSIKIRFVPRDFWIGAYVARPILRARQIWREVYICLLPMLPIILTFVGPLHHADAPPAPIEHSDWTHKGVSGK